LEAGPRHAVGGGTDDAGERLPGAGRASAAAAALAAAATPGRNRDRDECEDENGHGGRESDASNGRFHGHVENLLPVRRTPSPIVASTPSWLRPPRRDSRPPA